MNKKQKYTAGELRDMLDEERGATTGLCSTELAAEVCSTILSIHTVPMFSGNDIMETEIGSFAVSFEAREFSGWLHEYVGSNLSLNQAVHASDLLEYYGINHTIWYAYKGVRGKDFKHISLPMSKIREEYPYLWNKWTIAGFEDLGMTPKEEEAA